MHPTPLENFLEAPEVEVVTQNYSNSIQNFESQSLILLDFHKNQLFVTFPALKTDYEVVWSRKLVRQKVVTLEHPLDTFNMHPTPLENFF